MKRNEFKEKVKQSLMEGAKDDVIGILNYIYRKEGGIDYSRGSKFINVQGVNYTPEELYKIYKKSK